MENILHSRIIVTRLFFRGLVVIFFVRLHRTRSARPRLLCNSCIARIWSLKFASHHLTRCSGVLWTIISANVSLRSHNGKLLGKKHHCKLCNTRSTVVMVHSHQEFVDLGLAYVFVPNRWIRLDKCCHQLFAFLGIKIHYFYTMIRQESFSS